MSLPGSTPPAPPTVSPAPPSRRRLRLTRPVVIVIVIVVLGAIGFVFRDQVTGSANDLQVGDCFDVPAGNTVTDVQHHPCTEAHTGEVFAVLQYPDDSNATYPAQADFESWTRQQCTPAFATYTGRDAASDSTLTFSAFFPLADSWSSGDRTVTCYLTRIDQQPMTQSYRLGS